MEVTSPSIIRAKLATALGQNRRHYWNALSIYLNGEIPRSEFDESIREYLNTPDIAQLHNAFIISLLNVAIVNPPPPPPDPKPHRKRSGSGRESNLKTWILGMHKKDRERIKALNGLAASMPSKARAERDEILAGRVLWSMPENKEPAGTHTSRLCSVTRGITELNIAERAASVAVQNNLTLSQGSTVPQLILLALEAKLKQLVTHAISLTSTSRTISSIQTTIPHGPKSLPISSFDALFTVAPAILPYRSAAALRLSLGDNTFDWEEEDRKRQEARSEGPQSQLTAILRGKATIYDAIANKGR